MVLVLGIAAALLMVLAEVSNLYVDRGRYGHVLGPRGRRSGRQMRDDGRRAALVRARPHRDPDRGDGGRRRAGRVAPGGDRAARSGRDRARDHPDRRPAGYDEDRRGGLELHLGRRREGSGLLVRAGGRGAGGRGGRLCVCVSGVRSVAPLDAAAARRRLLRVRLLAGERRIERAAEPRARPGSRRCDRRPARPGRQPVPESKTNTCGVATASSACATSCDSS